MDLLCLLKSISLNSCQDTKTSSQHLEQFHSIVTPTILIDLITQLEGTTKQLAKINMLHEEKQKLINKLTKECDSDLVKIMSEDLFSLGRWHWPEIIEKKKLYLEKILELTIEDGSVFDKVLSSVALESREGAYAAVAAALGIDSRALQAVLLTWEENQDSPPPHITFDELKTKIMLYKQLIQAT